jgi:hypothetical protein
VEDEATAGTVSFATEPATRVVGVTTANVYALVDGKHGWKEAKAVHQRQSPEGRLDLRQWLTRTRPSGPHLLRFALRCEGPFGEEFRMGVAPLSPAELASGRLEVQALPRGATRVVVETEGGTAIPGVVVVVDPVPLALGRISTGVVTGLDGTALVSGLDPGGAVSVSIPRGVGPATERVQKTFRSPTDRVVLTVALRGRWAFDRISVVGRELGQSAVVASVSEPTARMPRIWPVTGCVLPGTGAPGSIHLIRRATTARPEVLSITFAGFPPLAITSGESGPEVTLPKARPSAPTPESAAARK